MSADKTSSSQSENEPLAKEASMDDTKDDDICDSKQDWTRRQYDAAYWKRVMRTGCMIMGFMSVVSMQSNCSGTNKFNGGNDITIFRESLRG